MKKTALIATAVAMAISGSAMAASHGGTKFYGKMELNMHNNGDLYQDSGKLIIGWKGSEDLGNGMTIGFGLELENDSADAEKVGFSNDKSYLFLKGDFGTVALGQHGTFRNWGCYTDTMKYDADRACDFSTQPTGTGNLVAYIGNAGDITFGVGAIFAGAGATATTASDGTMHTTFAAKYANGPIKAGASMLSLDGGATVMNLGGSYQMGDMTIAASMGDNEDDSMMGVQVKIKLDKASHVVVGTNLEASDDTASSVEIGYFKNLSKRTYMRAEFQSVDGADDSMMRGTLGHKF